MKPISIILCALLICGAAGSVPQGPPAPDQAAEEAGLCVMAEVPWERINQCGHQPYAGAGQAVCWAYCRIILDGEAHRYTEYWRGETAASPLAAGYSSFARAASKQALLEVLRENIDKGCPVVLGILDQHTRSRFVVVIGYRDNPSPGTGDVFLILDPADPSIRPENGDRESYAELPSSALDQETCIYAVCG